MARLWRIGSPVLAPAAMALGLALGGCSYQLGSMLGKDEDKGKPTGALAAETPPAAELAADPDLSYARAAVAEALAKGGKTRSTPWENPRTGARGMVTPIASAYTQDGFQCRDFLASYVLGGTESWLEGEACRIHQGRWEVRSLKPWKRT